MIKRKKASPVLSKKPEIKKEKKMEKPQEKPQEKAAPVVSVKTEPVAQGPLCVVCHKPVAEGQTEVCKEHIRRG